MLEIKHKAEAVIREQELTMMRKMAEKGELEENQRKVNTFEEDDEKNVSAAGS